MREGGAERGSLPGSARVKGAVVVTSDRKDVPIDLMVKQNAGATYLFAVEMRNAPARGAFRLSNPRPGASAEVIGERRRIPIRYGRFEDRFAAFDVHLYRIR